MPAETLSDILSRLRQQIASLSVDDLHRHLGEPSQNEPPPLLIDVRDTEEFNQGHLPRAVHISRSFLEREVEQQAPDRDTDIVVYCGGEMRSLLAADSLVRLGYRRVRVLDGGLGQWKTRGYPTERKRSLTEAQRNRYLRHVRIPEVGEAGQLELLDSKVAIVGAGGLGSPVAYYLAAAGVGTLGIVDYDTVEESNLQRQILHNAERVGESKVDSARRTIEAFNPGIQVVCIEERIDKDNVERILSGFHVVVDGSDNFPTRYLVNDCCVKLGIPCVHGSVFRFDGQVSVFDPKRGGPCYRCVYPEPPPPELAPSCAEAGVLGILPGVVGLLEAVETVKVLLGLGDILVGRMLDYDALSATFREYKQHKNPDCDYCGEGKPFPGFIEYDWSCVAS